MIIILTPSVEKGKRMLTFNSGTVYASIYMGNRDLKALRKELSEAGF